MNKNKITTIIIILITLILATVAVVTGIKLYNISKKPSTSPRPTSVSEATPEVFEQDFTDICQLSFNVEASPVPSEEASPAPISTPPPGCWNTCVTDTQCGSSLSCLDVNGVKRCVNPSCPTESDCVCAVTSAPAETLISAGIVSPTLILGLSGLLLIILGILL